MCASPPPATFQFSHKVQLAFLTFRSLRRAAPVHRIPHLLDAIASAITLQAVLPQLQTMRFHSVKKDWGTQLLYSEYIGHLLYSLRQNPASPCPP